MGHDVEVLLAVHRRVPRRGTRHIEQLAHQGQASVRRAARVLHGIQEEVVRDGTGWEAATVGGNGSRALERCRGHVVPSAFVHDGVRRRAPHQVARGADAGGGWQRPLARKRLERTGREERVLNSMQAYKRARRLARLTTCAASRACRRQRPAMRCTEVEGYSASVRTLGSLRLVSGNVFGDDSAQQMATVTENVAGGYVASLTVTAGSVGAAAYSPRYESVHEKPNTIDASYASSATAPENNVKNSNFTSTRRSSDGVGPGGLRGRSRDRRSCASTASCCAKSRSRVSDSPPPALPPPHRPRQCWMLEHLS